MNVLLRVYRSLLRPYWPRLVLIGLLALASSLAPYLFGYLARIMVDQVLEIRVGEGSIASRQPIALRMNLFTFVVAALVGSRVILILTNALYTYLLRSLAFRIIYDIRHQMHDRLQRLQVAYFDRNMTGKIMARLLDDVGTLNQSVGAVFVPALTQVTALLIGVVILFSIDPALAVLALVAISVCVVTYQYYIRRVRRVLHRIRGRNTQVYGRVGDVLNGMRVVKSFVQELRERRHFLRLNIRRFRLLMDYAQMDAGLAAFAGLASAVGLALVFYLGALRVRSGVLTVGDFLFFYGSAGLLFAPVNTLLSLQLVAQGVRVAARKVFEILDQEVTIHDQPNAREVERSTGWVVFANVSFRYPGFQRETLRGLTFEVPPASRVALVGPSGAGKSTIANLLVRFYDPTDGSILLDMEDIRDVRLASLRRHIRIVPQEPILFTGTLRNVIRYGHPEATDADMEAAARTAQIHDFIQTLPEGYDTVMGKEGVSLSGGQAQRLAFAMALVTNPTVLILDDSLSALDAETASQLEDAMEEIMRGRTVFIITHRLATAMRSDLILVLDRGCLVEQGTHVSLMARGGHYARLFSTQAEMQLARSGTPRQ